MRLGEFEQPILLQLAGAEAGHANGDRRSSPAD
jgi:hypothetical protein